jgi:hypothetical protein
LEKKTGFGASTIDFPRSTNDLVQPTAKTPRWRRTPSASRLALTLPLGRIHYIADLKA